MSWWLLAAVAAVAFALGVATPRPRRRRRRVVRLTLHATLRPAPDPDLWAPDDWVEPESRPWSAREVEDAYRDSVLRPYSIQLSGRSPSLYWRLGEAT